MPLGISPSEIMMVVFLMGINFFVLVVKVTFSVVVVKSITASIHMCKVLAQSVCASDGGPLRADLARRTAATDCCGTVSISHSASVRRSARDGTCATSLGSSRAVGGKDLRTETSRCS